MRYRINSRNKINDKTSKNMHTQKIEAMQNNKCDIITNGGYNK